MAEVIDMQSMRYINLFEKVSGVSTTKVFIYNNQIIYAVPKSKVSVAIGKNAVNVKKLSDILRRKIKIITMPVSDSNESISKFIEEVVSPVEFNKVDINDNSIVITAGRESKASLIGRNRIREKEMGDVLKNFFHVGKLRIA
jgi:N utilization substance protein A